MTATNQKIIEALASTEAWAEGLQRECQKARKLIEGEVSTSPKSQETKTAVAKVLAKREQHIIKKNKLNTHGKI